MLARFLELISRTTAVFHPHRLDQETDDELSVHLSLLKEQLVRQGMTPEDAAYAARRQFGGVSQLKQELFEARSLVQLQIFYQDARHAAMALFKDRGFAATALMALTLGIGVNVAVFSVVNAVLLKPLRAPGGDRIVQVQDAPQGVAWSRTVGFPEFNIWREQAGALEDISAYRLDFANLTGGSYPELVPVARVTEGFFRLFGAPVFSGRTFSADEDHPGGRHVAVLSYAFWQSHLARDPEVLGQRIVLGRDTYSIIGVLGPNFNTEQFDHSPDVWVPFQIEPSTTDHGSYCYVAGRLKAGITIPMAIEQLRPIMEEYRRRFPTTGPKASFTVHPLQDAMVNDIRASLLLLLGAVSFVLLIACSNLANLLLVRSEGRKREIAIRAALGGGRGRIIRQLLTESVILSLIGGALGLAAGFLSVRALLMLYPTNPLGSVFNPQSLPRIGEGGSGVALDWRVLAFTVLVSLVTAVLSGLIPARRASRVDLNALLKDGSGRFGTGRAQNKTRSLLVIGQIALALVMLIGAALLIRTYIALHLVDPGFDSRGVLTLQMSLSATRFERTSEMDQLVHEGVRRISALPGVVDVASGCCLPLELTWQLPFIIAGRPLSGPLHGMAGWTFISPLYFETFHIPVLRGRAFTNGDKAGAPGVVIINQAMARREWPNGNPLNDRLIIGKGMRPEYEKDSARQIVGIVGDVRDVALNRTPRPAMYVPIAQLPDGINLVNLQLLPIAWFVRARGDPQSLGSAVEKELRLASDGLPVANTRSMSEIEAQSTARAEFQMALMTTFGVSALLLAAIGIYGLMAYSVRQRTQEFGIRLALGADSKDVRSMVVREAMLLALLGVTIGVPTALGLTHLIGRFLFGVKAWDPVVFTTVPVFLCAVVLSAIWVPALRATCVDPAEALRNE